MTSNARADILASIRSHLAESVPHDRRELALRHQETPGSGASVMVAPQCTAVDLFKQSLEAVNGHCVIVYGESEVVQTLNQLVGDLQKTDLRAQRVALSDNAELERLLQLTDLEIEELGLAPDAHEIFRFDLGISTAQAGIAETGTLVLDSSLERHRLVSLVPPVHIVILSASQIRETLADVLAMMQENGEVNPAVSFVTGPSRTADIELTLAIGVHGPQELYVIIDGSN